MQFYLLTDTDKRPKLTFLITVFIRLTAQGAY